MPLTTRRPIHSRHADAASAAVPACARLLPTRIVNGQHRPSRPCALAPNDKQRQTRRVGEDLLRHHGKRNFYSVQQVHTANQRNRIDLDVACWSHALFNTHEDFDQLHAAAGEACDYLAMKAEMLRSLTRGGASSWFDFDLSWLEFPDLDVSLFDFSTDADTPVRYCRRPGPRLRRWRARSHSPSPRS